MERETGFEPAASTLARSRSTTELFPQNLKFSNKKRNCNQKNKIFQYFLIKIMWWFGFALDSHKKQFNAKDLAMILKIATLFCAIMRESILMAQWRYGESSKVRF